MRSGRIELNIGHLFLRRVILAGSPAARFLYLLLQILPLPHRSLQRSAKGFGVSLKGLSVLFGSGVALRALKSGWIEEMPICWSKVQLEGLTCKSVSMSSAV